MTPMLRTGAALLIALTAHGAIAQQTQFEVASIKPADPKATVAGPLFAGGPGTNDPGHIVYRGASLTYLLMTAYKLKGFQLSGPKWMDTARFYIDAKLPSGATKDDLRAMLRNLLAERFGVTIHSEKKELQSYTLLVSKRGVKMKPSPPIVADTDGTAQHLDAGIETDDDGFPVFPAGSTGGLVVMNRAGKMKVGAAQQSLAAICDFLSTQLGAPVDDQTALIGNYDFHLEYAIDGPITLGRGGPVMPPPNPAASGEAITPGELPGSLRSALQEQLGLRLERGRALVDIVVLDHVERTPAAN
jgi:uncharacterized protein (TIGR03435 family)